MSKVSREYLAAGGDEMTREQAVRHFSNRMRGVSQKVRALPTAEKFRLVAELMEAVEQGKLSDHDLPLRLARLALSELERDDE